MSGSSEMLAIKYRPQKFSHMVGQNMVARVLDQFVKKNSIPTALLFSGTRGTGKTSAARILAKELDAEAIEIDAASNGGVADVRTLIETLRYSSGSEHRVVIMDECHSMSREAFNALLKTLEEPPSGTIFILVTTEPERVPETVLSRLMEFQFRRISPAEICERLTKIAGNEKIPADVGLLSLISERSEGSMRDALMALDMINRSDVTTVEDFEKLVGERDDSPELLLAASTGDFAQIRSELDRQMGLTGDANFIVARVTKTLSDLLVLRAGGKLIVTGKQLEQRLILNQRLEPDRIQRALRIMWEVKTKIAPTDNPRGSLDLAIMLLSEAFTAGRNIARKSPAVVAATTPVSTPEPSMNAPHRLTLAEMQKG